MPPRNRKPGESCPELEVGKLLYKHLCFRADLLSDNHIVREGGVSNLKVLLDPEHPGMAKQDSSQKAELFWVLPREVDMALPSKKIVEHNDAAFIRWFTLEIGELVLTLLYLRHG